MPNVSWGISFETIGKRFEYVRHGAEWDRLVHNLRYLRDAKVNNIDSHPVYCNYSAFNLMEYYEFLSGEGYFNNQYWQLLQNIEGLDTFRLSNPMKIKALTELEKCFAKYESTFDMKLLRPIYDELKLSMGRQRRVYDSRKAILWLDELEESIPGKREGFKELWPEMYEDFANTYRYSLDDGIINYYRANNDA
jgi:hypothetical protein